MYIKDLRPNTLVIPSEGYTWQLGRDDSEEQVLRQHGIAGHILMHHAHRDIPGYARFEPKPAVYLYARRDDWLYGGVYKHHYLLIGDTLAIMDGYQFAHVELLKKE